jgi:hypothetical protein
MDFKCENCEKIFTEKRYYDQHLRKKIPCNPTKRDLYDINKCKCEYCFDIFSTPQSMRRHTTTCAKNSPDVDKLTIYVNTLQNEIIELKKQIGNINNKLANTI